MKSVLISIRPKWCQKIANSEKTIEVRKKRPKLAHPFKCYIYCTQAKRPYEDFIETEYPKPQFYGGGKVIGEFVCDEIFDLPWGARIPSDIARGACLEPGEIHQYLGVSSGYGWHISNLKIYDTPRELSEFWRGCPEYSELSTNCWICENVCGDGDETDCNTNGRLYLRRPPQSWCYVEGDI